MLPIELKAQRPHRARILPAEFADAHTGKSRECRWLAERWHLHIRQTMGAAAGAQYQGATAFDPALQGRYPSFVKRRPAGNDVQLESAQIIRRMHQANPIARVVQHPMHAPGEIPGRRQTDRIGSISGFDV